MSDEPLSTEENPLWQIILDNLEDYQARLTFAKTTPYLYDSFGKSYICSRMPLTCCGRQLSGSSYRIIMRPLRINVRQLDMSKRLTIIATEQPNCENSIITRMRIVVLLSDSAQNALDSTQDTTKSTKMRVNCGKIEFMVDLYQIGNKCTKIYTITRKMIIDDYVNGDMSNPCVGDHFIAKNKQHHLGDLSTVMRRIMDDRGVDRSAYSSDELSDELTRILIQIGLNKYPTAQTTEYIERLIRKVCARLRSV